MNTIEIEGQTYEVLTLDRISEITHAKLAGGAVTPASLFANPCSSHARIKLLNVEETLRHCFYAFELEPFCIQPLRLVPREPVTFEAECYQSRNSDDWCILHSDDEALRNALWRYGTTTKRFRCVEIVEEAK